MADGIIKRFVRVIFDRSSAKKAEQELAEGMGAAGKKAGDNFVRELKASFAKEMASLKTQLAKGIIDEKEFKKRADAAAKTFNKGIVEGMEKARKAGTLTDKEFIKLGNTLKRTGDQGFFAGGRIQSAFAKLGATLAAAFTIQKGIQFFKDSITAALEAERSVQRLDSALKPLGTSYKQVGKEAEAYLDRLQETTRFSDEDAREALTALVTGTGDYKRSLELLDVTAKIAEKRQISMADAAGVALKLSQGLTKGMLDLGIGAGETGDLIKKVSDNLGDIAVAFGRTNEGVIKRAANLWDEFQENIGLAVLGSEAWKDGSSGLIKTLIDMNKWVQENNKSIGEAANNVALLVGWLARLVIGVNQFITNPFGFIGQALKGKPSTADPLGRVIPVPGKPGPAETAPTAGTRGTPTPKAGKKTDAEKEAERAEKKLAHDREALAREVAIREMMYNAQVTEAYATEQLRRQELLGQAAPVLIGTVEDNLKRLNQLNLLLAAGFDNNLNPVLAKTKGAVGELVPVVDNMADAFQRAEQKLVDDAAFQAELYKTPWIDALGTIRNEVEGEGTLFMELGQAWAEGGVAGLAQLAKAKFKENIARVIEELAKAAGSFALGNPAAAALHLKSAAGHGAAAIAWKGVGAASGGGGGGGSSAGGSVGGSTGNAASNSKPAESEINIYLTGPGWDALNPEVQRVVYGAQQNARERWGDNAKIRVRRGP